MESSTSIASDSSCHSVTSKSSTSIPSSAFRSPVSFLASSSAPAFSSRPSLLPSVNFADSHIPHTLPLSSALIPLFGSSYGARWSTASYTMAPASRLPPALLWKTFFSSSSSTNPPEYKDYKVPVNPPDAENPDAATLREQWSNAIRLYSRWYSHAWGTAILAGCSLFALGWWIKGENPLSPLSPTGNIKKEEASD